jgi:uncharacterized membrane protein YgcG
MKMQLPILVAGLMVCSALLAAGCHEPTNVAAAPYDQPYYEDTPNTGYVPYDDDFMPGYYYGQGYPGYYGHHFYSHRSSLGGGGYEGGEHGDFRSGGEGSSSGGHSAGVHEEHP